MNFEALSMNNEQEYDFIRIWFYHLKIIIDIYAYVYIHRYVRIFPFLLDEQCQVDRARQKLKTHGDIPNVVEHVLWDKFPSCRNNNFRSSMLWHLSQMQLHQSSYTAAFASVHLSFHEMNLCRQASRGNHMVSLWGYMKCIAVVLKTEDILQVTAASLFLIDIITCTVKCSRLQVSLLASVSFCDFIFTCRAE